MRTSHVLTNVCERYIMRKKKNEEKDFEQKLSEVEFPECDDGHSKREKETIHLLKQIVNQNKQVIQLLTEELTAIKVELAKKMDVK